ncbi:MAG: hypothetical protein U0793_25265 [Gemmataceae bacterium]
MIESSTTDERVKRKPKQASAHSVPALVSCALVLTVYGAGAGPSREIGFPKPVHATPAPLDLRGVHIPGSEFIVLAADPPEIVIRPTADLPPLLRKKIDNAVDRGVAFLKRVQGPSGSFGDTVPIKRVKLSYPEAYAALPGLALLESGMPPDDPVIQRAANLVRKLSSTLTSTYEIALAALFLERLGAPEDCGLSRSLALRLAAGQGVLGGWGYTCPALSPAQEERLLQILREKSEKTDLPDPKAKAPVSDIADNSNTQFAVLALAAMRKYDLPLDHTFKLVERRFRASLKATGWGYKMGMGGFGGMTCAGLLGLATARASGAKDVSWPEDRSHDEGIARGLAALSRHMADPRDRGAGDGPTNAINLYFFWSVERVGVLCGVDTIGGRDWYRWGVDLLLPNQNADGSWTGRGNGDFAPVVDTSMALLFLRRADLLPDLRESLQERLSIIDPGPGTKTGSKKSPSEKKARPVKDKESGTVRHRIDLGSIKTKQFTKMTLQVRGPGSFRITGIRGGDDEIRVELTSSSEDAHQLTFTFNPQKTGDLHRRIYLVTDILGQSLIPLQLRAKSEP